MRRLLFAAVAAAAIILSGCSTTVTGSPAPTGAVTGGTVAATTDPVAWMDNVCGSLLPVQQTLATAPQPTSDDPAATAKSISAFLGRSENAIDQSLAGLDAVGPSPIADGDAAVAELKSALTTIRRSFDRTKTAIDKIDPTNAVDVATTLPTVFATLAELAKIQDSTPRSAEQPRIEGRRGPGAQLPDFEEIRLTACRRRALSAPLRSMSLASCSSWGCSLAA